MKKVLEAINKVKQETEAVSKTGKNQAQRYKYATHNDVLNEVRDSLVKNKLVIIPTDVKDIHTIEKEKSNVHFFTQVYTAYHVDEGVPVEICIRCAGSDSGDKSAYKANTGAMKYLFIDLFNLPTDADPENDSNDVKTPAKKLSPPSYKTESPSTNSNPWLNPNTKEWDEAVAYLKSGKPMAGLYQKYKIGNDNRALLEQLLK